MKVSKIEEVLPAGLLVNQITDLLTDHQTDMTTETEGSQREEKENFILQPVVNVKRKPKYLSSQQELNQYTVVSVIKNINRRMDLEKQEVLLVVLEVNQIIDLLAGHPTDMTIEIEDSQREEKENFTLQPAVNVKRKPKYLSNQQELNQSTAVNAFKNINHRMDLEKQEVLLVGLEVNQIIDLLADHLQDMMTETELELMVELNNSILSYVLIVKKKHRYLSNQQELNQYTVESVFKIKN